MKYVLSLFLILALILPARAHAAAETVWFTQVPSDTPSKLLVGDPILVYAKVNNVTKDPVTYVLAFTTTDKTIGTKVVIVAGYSNQEISIPWSMPTTSTVVTVSIAKATDKNKKELKALIGPIGATTVGAIVEGPDITPIKGWIGTVIVRLEGFRVAQLQYFTALKEDASSVLSRTTIKDVTNLLQPESPSQNTTDAHVQVEKKDNGTTMGYVKLVYATAGKALFANKTIYFVAVILLALLVIRLILKLLMR